MHINKKMIKNKKMKLSNNKPSRSNFAIIQRDAADLEKLFVERV